MSKALITEQYLTDIASAIRTKAGVSQTFTPAQMASGILAIPTGGGGNTDGEDGLVTRTLSGTYSNSRVTTVGQGAFTGCTALTSVTLTNVTTIYDAAFSGCTALSSFSLPKLTTICSSAFQQCGLTNISLPSVSYINSASVFYGCSRLTSVTCDNLVGFGPTSSALAGYNTFAYCTSLTYVSMPNLQYVGKYTFQGCTALTEISLPKVIRINDYAFRSCYALSSVILPKVQVLSSSAFAGCSALSRVDLSTLTSVGSAPFSGAGIQYFRAVALPYVGGTCLADAHELKTAILSKASYITGSAFVKCYNLISLYLLSTAVVKYSTASCFVSTPISNYSTSAGRWGSVFVRASLYSAYLTATRWSVISDRIVSLTDAEIAALLA